MSIVESFISEAFLRTAWAAEFDKFLGSGEEKALLSRIKNWSKRHDLKETSAQQAFVEEFFHDTWGYYGSGQKNAAQGFTSYPSYTVKGAGQTGSAGSADLALGWFGLQDAPETPQVLCEFKDIKSALDAPQKRKGNNRSPVKQCIDYLSNARRGMFGNEALLPTWGIATDMNEFRLYWYDRAPHQYLRFVITPDDPLLTRGLLDESDEGRLNLFLFWKVFQSDTLLGKTGKSALEKQIARQWVKERKIENTYYSEYRVFRDRLYQILQQHNPKFPGTPGRLVQLTQKILDRCIFLFYCEDMGRALGFPHQLLRDFLIHHSQDQYYDRHGTIIWDRLKDLFGAMNTGGPFPPDHDIKCFNGGLFRDDSELNALVIPNFIFCEPGQGENEASLHRHPDTLLYLSAAYNYAAKGDAKKSIGLYTLGRIFEQSITELEILEAKAEGRESLNEITKRKRDGVYYTPEHVVQKIVDETLGLRLAEIKEECGWEDEGAPDQKAAEAYWKQLREIKVLDPACGSGAFLITCMQMLLMEYRTTLDQLRRFKKTIPMAEDTQLIKDILARNLYGVDINPSSVEIAQLALWLYSARPNEELSALDKNIRCGNSLIDSTFYIKGDLEKYAEEEKERINAFDWWEAFPEIKERGGFDVVVSNPPYVRLQNFHRVHPDMTEYLREGRQGASYYESTQVGNFDIYMPFIEKGLSLLNEKGRMGYIAPSVWVLNNSGIGLRKKLAQTRQLDRWADFVSFQVFEEATNYTALQFFTGGANDAVRISPAPDGDLTTINWDDPKGSVPCSTLNQDEPWALLPRPERLLMERLQKSCRRLDDKNLTSAIFQGLITSADSIYHLRRLGPERYLQTFKDENGQKQEREVAIEDALMKPLVSGPVAKRYMEPKTETYILFPYKIAKEKAHLISQEEMKVAFPKAWKYLKSYEINLRGREYKKFDDSKWYRFGRSQNLTKQHLPKLAVPRLVAHLKVCADEVGEFYLDSIDVGGILPATSADLFYLLAVLNGPVATWVFRRISKPFRGNYRSANKQYIAPLPVPECGEKARREIKEKAQFLQRDYAGLHELEKQRAKRLKSVKVRSKPESWIFPEIGTLEDLLANPPATLVSSEHKEWAKGYYSAVLEARYEELQRFFSADARLEAEYTGGELRFLINGKSAIERVFVDEDEGPFIQAQWQQAADKFSMTEKAKSKNLVTALRKIASTDNHALKEQVVKLQQQITGLRNELQEQEKHLNELLYKAYGLTDEERRLIEQG